MRRLCRVALVWAVVLCIGSAAWAVLLPDPELFYDPWEVPTAQYPIIELNTTWDGSQVGNNSVRWDEFNDVYRVQVLPLLKPFPGDEPAMYPPGYPFTQDDYEYQPNVHYWVDLTAGVAEATFMRPGIFHVKLSRMSGPEQVFAVFVDSGLLDGDSSGSSVKIDGPKADLVVVSKPSGGDSLLDKAAANAADDNGADKVKRAANAQECIDQIKAASQAAGKKIHVELVAHGNKGFFRMGSTAVGGADMSIEDFQKAIDDYCNELSIYACDFASGATGKAAVDILAKSIGNAIGYTGLISVHRSDWWGWLVGGSWDLEMGATSRRIIYGNTLSAAKTAPNNSEVKVTTPVVATANLSTCFYVESPDRSCGIRVQSPIPAPPVGTTCEIEGVVNTTPHGERFIQATEVIYTGIPEPVREVMVTVSRLGGGQFGFQEATAGGAGLNNVGMLVSCAGIVHEPNIEWFRLSDTGNFGLGVKVIMPPGMALPPPMHAVRVTGVVSCEREGPGIRPVILMRDPDDLRFYGPWLP